MCGIIGIISTKDVYSNLYVGLLALQHRGQDACGVCVHDGEDMHVKRDVGLVRDVFTDNDAGRLSGKIGIGHVRYTTAGKNITKNTQPFKVRMPVDIIMASNGNTINTEELVDFLWDNNISMHTTSDLEAILGVFKFELKKEAGRSKVTSEHVFNAAQKMMNRVRGSYSLVIMVEGVGLLAVRDPYAIKPLVFGKSGDGKNYVFASESVAIDVLGYKAICDVKAGEAILVDFDFNVTRRIIGNVTKKAHCMFEFVYFARPDSVLDHVSVYEARLELGRELARKWSAKEIDTVIAAPDTSRTAALAFANEIGVNYREGLIKNRYIGRTFIMPSDVQRKDAIRIKINPISSEIKGKKIALVDDSIVRGTTAKKTIELLRSAGAKEVHLLSSCPPIIKPCIYGIDMPTHEELIAHNRSVDEIDELLGADSLTYQSIEGLERAIPIDHLCTACISGKYPIPMDGGILKRIAEKRKKEKED
ncbi:MAG: amidophosphoribosyltransferase [Candidatus Nanohalarchaeota archaeon]|nr:MAG: amidophosphoribosyltransferase [Candidatus Nanohaloarchaeota archaeon]